MQVAPRHSIYVSSETTGSFIVDAALSHTFGEPYHGSTGIEQQPFQDLYFTIAVETSDIVLVANSVAINSTDNLFDFDFHRLQPRMDAYDIVLYGVTPGGDRVYSARTQLFYLPDKTTGSVTKIDNLNGGMLFKNNATGKQFEPLLPFGFYADYSGYLALKLENVKAYHDQGFNVIHPVTSFMDSDNLTTILDYMDEINLLWQYDMRGSYQNLTSVAEQVALAKDHTSLLAYYTADEPDGWQYPLNSTKLAYDLIATIDKYHPVGLVLNCQNFYFKDYSQGADYLMEDAYPVGINATWSVPWNTPCNATYGDCGCDNCVGELQDVSNRLDAFAEYQGWLGGQWAKPLWAVPQAFDGNGYWARNPTVDEAWVMNALSLNHGAKGIMSWIYPPVPELATAHSEQAKVVTVSPVLDFLTGAQPQRIVVAEHPLLDVAYWVVGGQALLNVVNLDYAATTATITVTLPFKAMRIASTPWGIVDWSLRGNSLTVTGLAGLATSMVILDM